MPRLLFALVLAALVSCSRSIIYCEGDPVQSPDGQCKAQMIQDATTDNTVAVVECNAWHYGPSPTADWNALVLRGTKYALDLKWTANGLIEVTIPVGASIKSRQAHMQGLDYVVNVVLREDSGTKFPGCGISR